MRETLPRALELMFGHEGGYSNNPRDPGGETKFGVSKRAYPAVDIRNLTLDQAKAIYLRDYWNPTWCDRVPAALRFDLFDMAVNSGISAAVKTLQRVAGVVDDGKMGPMTLAAIQRLDAVQARARFNGARLDFMTRLSNWDAFAKGWARRIAANLMQI